jgi:hypothetical protein
MMKSLTMPYNIFEKQKKNVSHGIF